MASSDGLEVRVSVESGIHGGVRKMAEEIWKEYSVRILDVRIDWNVDTPLVGETVATVRETEIRTKRS